MNHHQVRLLEKAAHIIKKEVRHEMRKRTIPKSIEYDDLVSEANYRICRKMKSFDSRVSLLHTFVEYHVRKAMTDYIRFWLYKNRTTGSSPKIRSITGVKSESDPKKQKIVDIADARQDPEMHYIRNRELWKFIRICCLGMPERYPLILYMYYMLEMEVNEIKRELGVTAGRVSQMKKEAAKRFLLRAANLKIQGTHEFYPRRCS